MSTAGITSLKLSPSSESSQQAGDGLYRRAFRKFFRDRAGVAGLSVVLLYVFVAILAMFEIIGVGWEELITDGAVGVSSEHWFGTNLNGQDIFKRAVVSTRTAFEVGLFVSVVSTMIGAALGGIAGFFSGRWPDELVIWFYGCLDSIPFYLFVAAVAFALGDNPYGMHIAMIATFWTSTARYIRGEVIKLKHFEFVQAAQSIGVSRRRTLFSHIMPNTFHIILVQVTITFVAAIKSEVILSFLGLGVKDGISWGLMLSEASFEVPSGVFNNFFAASGFMFVLVIAFNFFSDALQDALDPKKVN